MNGDPNEPTDVDLAMHAARTGSAGHWPTVATVLHGEIERLWAIEERAREVAALGMPRLHAHPTDEPGAQVRTARYVLDGGES